VFPEPVLQPGVKRERVVAQNLAADAQGFLFPQVTPWPV
jgi:hypothetical protein